MPRSVEVSMVRFYKIHTTVYEIVLNMKYRDEDGTVLINKDYTQRCAPGAAITAKVMAFTAAMQKTIDDYKSGNVIYDESQITSLVDAVEGNLEV